MLRICCPEAIGAATVFWAARLDKYLILAGSFEAMSITVFTQDSDFGAVNGEHLP